MTTLRELDEFTGFLTVVVFSSLVIAVLLFSGTWLCISKRTDQSRAAIKALEQRLTSRSVTKFKVERLEQHDGRNVCVTTAGGYVYVTSDTHWAKLKVGQSYRALTEDSTVVQIESWK